MASIYVCSRTTNAAERTTRAIFGVKTILKAMMTFVEVGPSAAIKAIASKILELPLDHHRFALKYDLTVSIITCI